MTVRMLRQGDIAVLEIDNPPVNAASQAVRAGLMAGLDTAGADDAIRAVVIAAAGRTFVAGADITEFGKPPLAPLLPDVIARIEAFAKPVVVVWHGTALGGGCELGLAAHARVAAPGTRIGLPEVKLGLVPGAGGTQRLPRLVGLVPAIEMATSGRMVGAQEALSLGLVDALAEDARAEAITLAGKLAGAPLRRTGALAVAPVEAAALEAARAGVRKRARGQSAPLEALRLMELAAATPLAQGLAEERATFLRLMAGEESAALRYLFAAEREASKLPVKAEPLPVRRLGVIGAGTMGAGIALAFVEHGFAVTVVEATPEALASGRARLEGLIERQVKGGKLDAAGAAARRALLTFSDQLSSLADVDLVIEAVFEDMAVKQDLLRKLEAVTRPGCVLATNTSYLDVDALGAVLADPSRLVGMHFFSPANIMKLLEVVRAQKTRPEVLASAVSLGKALGKIVVVAGVCDGFIGNRILARYRTEAEAMLKDGALPQEIDAAFEGYGFPMGPFAMSDLAGLDIGFARRKRLGITGNPADALCAQGRLGQKTGAGWYRYVEGKRVVDPEVEALLVQWNGGRRATLAPEAIMARILAAMADEGGKILEEGIAARAGDIDVVLVNGYAFPAHKGGPMFQASRQAG